MIKFLKQSPHTKEIGMFRVYDALGTVNGTPGFFWVYTDGREATPAYDDAEYEALIAAKMAEQVA